MILNSLLDKFKLYIFLSSARLHLFISSILFRDISRYIKLTWLLILTGRLYIRLLAMLKIYNFIFSNNYYGISFIKLLSNRNVFKLIKWRISNGKIFNLLLFNSKIYKFVSSKQISFGNV